MAKRICPRCGSRSTAPILWGMPAFDEELAVKIAKKDIFIGGCCVGIDDPAFHCYKCKKDFGHPTLSQEMMTKSIQFSLGGYFGGYQDIAITFREMGASILFTPPFREAEETIKKVYDIDETKKMIHSLYLCNIIDWKKSYDDPEILDGTQ